MCVNCGKFDVGNSKDMELNAWHNAGSCLKSSVATHSTKGGKAPRGTSLRHDDDFMDIPPFDEVEHISTDIFSSMKSPEPFQKKNQPNTTPELALYNGNFFFITRFNMFKVFQKLTELETLINKPNDIHKYVDVERIKSDVASKLKPEIEKKLTEELKPVITTRLEKEVREEITKKIEEEVKEKIFEDFFKYVFFYLVSNMLNHYRNHLIEAVDNFTKLHSKKTFTERLRASPSTSSKKRPHVEIPPSSVLDKSEDIDDDDDIIVNPNKVQKTSTTSTTKPTTTKSTPHKTIQTFNTLGVEDMKKKTEKKTEKKKTKKDD